MADSDDGTVQRRRPGRPKGSKARKSRTPQGGGRRKQRSPADVDATEAAAIERGRRKRVQNPQIRTQPKRGAVSVVLPVPTQPQVQALAAERGLGRIDRELAGIVALDLASSSARPYLEKAAELRDLYLAEILAVAGTAGPTSVTLATSAALALIFSRKLYEEDEPIAAAKLASIASKDLSQARQIALLDRQLRNEAAAAETGFWSELTEAEGAP